MGGDWGGGKDKAASLWARFGRPLPRLGVRLAGLPRKERNEILPSVEMVVGIFWPIGRQASEEMIGGCGTVVRRRTTTASPKMNGPRVRIRFCKQGDLRWIGHRDLVRGWERLFRRAGIPLAHSQGFHPKPKMSFPSALALGIEGLDEVMEVELAEPCSVEELQTKLSAFAPPGLGITHLAVLPPGAPKARVRSVCYRIAVPAEREASISEWIARWAGGEGADPAVGLPSALFRALETIRLEEGQLEFTLRMLPDGLPSGREILAALQLADLETHGAVLTRTQVELEPSCSGDAGGRS